MTARITVQVAGTDAIAREWPKRVDASIRRRLTTAINRLTLDVQRQVKTHQLNKPKASPTGTGGALSRRTGNLSRSINRRTEDTPTRVLGSVGTNVIYGRAWEFGRVKNWRRTVQPARPFLRPVLDQMRQQIEGTIRAALGRGGAEV